MLPPLVSIIVPVYNQANYLAETLNSVLSQTYNQWECIIINDGSSDGSETIAKFFCQKDKRFSYIFQENQGVVSARNKAIRKSVGKYILPLDGDDIIEKKYLELAVPIMERDETIKITCCEVELFGYESRRMSLPSMSIRNMLSRNCCVCSSLFRRKDFDRIGGYKEYMKDGLEDWDFFLSIIAEGGKNYKIDKVLFHYRVVKDSRNRSIDKMTHDYLINNIVSHHALLYYDEYNKILNELSYIQNSRVFKLMIKIKYFIDFFKRIFIYR